MRGKIAMPVIAALVLLMTVGGGAAAAPPEGLETYDAGADGKAFDLQVNLADALQLQLAAGLTAAGVNSDGPAAAGDAVGLLLAPPASDPIEQTGAHAAAPDGEASVEDCAAEVELPAPLDLTDGTCIAGVSATAVIDDGAPAADGVSDSLTLSIGGAELTEQLLGALPIEDITTALGGLLSQLTDALCDDGGLPLPEIELPGLLPGLPEIPVTGALADLVCNLDDAATIVQALIDSLASAISTTLTITLAPNQSLAEASAADGVVASAVANGVTIDVLPGLGPDGTSFLEVIVGSSEASVVRDAVTGEATPVVTPAVADVNVNGIDVGGAVADLGLGTLVDPVVALVNGLINQLATASPLTCGEPGPLAQIICLDAAAGFILDAEEAAAEGYDFGEGTVGARTSALRLELLSIVNGGDTPAVSLSLAEAVAAANATPAMPAQPTTAPPTTEESLPRTGSGDFAPLALAAGLGLAGVVLGLRRRLIG